ncbi:MerR family transcriptional regulator [Lactobacillus sanfranciscensis]|uniref:MerR family transcriptional regulator n=1 Tax=Fructilactobacillus sanfranciscensis TaxID=1625 RepID=UPI0002D3A01C|nr:MerR family transcriptional regulator [Fructilactobacillus sanfranciscensis]NDR75866.1 MerR family transcriptional regulator [Fructilactobacillus sanfranciscensis]NDR96448.1 MerR family transcriptional regulator [Fructilactobacillus sanfranciscensis]NDS04236.1 MerR family transcriptional regulator [Fructilactobacillus sanfranciscensis]
MKKDLVTVSQLANLSGITPRTIRYYDKIDLLKPTLIDKNGYRKYNLKQLNRLQQILYFKQFGFELARIKTMIDADDYNIVVSLEHQQALLAKEAKRKQILLDNLKQTVKYYKGEINMTNLEKFKVFKNELIMQNEEKYGKEVSEKYGEVKHQ